jgi:SPP1 gp7 family putative phage head morphogenesis protein
MPPPSKAERSKTRKRRLAAEAAFLLLLLRALKKKQGLRAALILALLRGQLPLRRLARDSVVAELRSPETSERLPALTQVSDLGKAELRRITKIVAGFLAYSRLRSLGADNKELKKQADTAVESRLRLIAANEAARVFEQERLRTARAVVRQKARAASKQWDATLDGATCDECSRLAGLRLPFNEEFPEGDPPLHPNCRCSIEYSFDT